MSVNHQCQKHLLLQFKYVTTWRQYYLCEDGQTRIFLKKCKTGMLILNRSSLKSAYLSDKELFMFVCIYTINLAWS